LRFYRFAKVKHYGYLFLLLIITLAALADVAEAESSSRDLADKIIGSLEEQMPQDIKWVALWKLDNVCGADIDKDELEEYIEMRVVQSDRFNYINREALHMAVKEFDLCSQFSCLMDPSTMQKFGNVQGIEAFIYGEIIDASSVHAGITDEDYYVTINLKALETATSGVIWSKMITGVNIENINNLLGALPDIEAIDREEALASSVADFINSSSRMESEGIKTLNIWKINNEAGVEIDLKRLYRVLHHSIVDKTDYTLVDRENMNLLLDQYDLKVDGITRQSDRQEWGRFFGIDAGIEIDIKEIKENSYRYQIRMTNLETTHMFEYEERVAFARNPEYKLSALLENAGPSIFKSEPSGAEVTVDGREIGRTTTEYILKHGDHSVTFSLEGFKDSTMTVSSFYAQPQTVSCILSNVPIIVFKSQPAGAQVSVGDSIIGNTPLTSTFSPGTHSIKYASRGYADSVFAVSAAYGEHKEVNISMNPLYSKVYVTSSPSDANIFLDGKPSSIGETPLSFSTKQGNHIIELKKQDYLSRTEEFSVYEPERALEYKLDYAFGILDIKSNVKGASISIDTLETDQLTPARIYRIIPGDYEIEIKKYGYENALKEVDVPITDVTSVYIPMAPKTRKKAFLRSLFIPGWGQFYKGDNKRGALFMLGSYSSAALAVTGYIKRENAIDEYNTAHGRYIRAVEQDVMDESYQTMQDKIDEIDKWKKLRDYGMIAAATFWTINIIDSAIGFPLAENGVEVGLENRLDGSSWVTFNYRFSGGEK